MNREEIKQTVISVLISIINDMPDLEQEEINESTLLLSEGSFIDSLTLVSFIVDLETVLANEYDIDISLTDDRAMTREKSPYDSIIALVEYIDELAGEQ